MASARSGATLAMMVAVGLVVALAAMIPLWLSTRRGQTLPWFYAQALAFAVIIAAFLNFPHAARQNRRSDDPDARTLATAIEPATSVQQ